MEFSLISFGSRNGGVVEKRWTSGRNPIFHFETKEQNKFHVITKPFVTN